jgi:hypothetical protein
MRNESDWMWKRLLPVREASLIAGLHAGSVWRMIREGRVLAYGRRGMLRVRLSDLLPPVTNGELTEGAQTHEED